MEEKKIYLPGEVVDSIPMTELKEREMLTFYKMEKLTTDTKLEKIVGFVHGSKDYKIQYTYSGRYIRPLELDYCISIIVNGNLVASYYEISKIEKGVI